MYHNIILCAAIQNYHASYFHGISGHVGLTFESTAGGGGRGGFLCAQRLSFIKYTVNMGKNIVKCTVCEKKLTGNSTALRHVEAIHFPGTYSYQCGSCGQEFGNFNSWAYHRSSHH